MSQLALFGGPPVLSAPLATYNSIGDEELEAVTRVMRAGCLSGFYGSWGEQFLGGPVVRAFEDAWRTRFGVRHAMSVNSATSGLYAAIGAVGIGPGDEVIVPPYTMSATAMAPLIYGGIPVFADIEPDTFCLDPAAVRRLITPRTKAILAVNLFGHPARLAELLDIANEHGLMLVEDNAQAPLAKEGDRFAGTIGHIGVFSLNYHKHVHTGEGGMCVTDDDQLARRLQLIRNHAESIVEDIALEDLTNMVGFNYRMTELCAAVGIEQLKKMDQHVRRRQVLAEQLTAGVADLEGLTPPRVRESCQSVYYAWALRLDEAVLGVSRERFSEALAAEGLPHGVGYVRPLYLLPLFQQRIALGRGGFPFTLSDRSYEAGLCPVAERMHQQELLLYEICMYDAAHACGERLVEAIRKVHRHRGELTQPAPGLTAERPR
jgi:dTDP-4-amino-4,6-dideoxygalactose transaminase